MILDINLFYTNYQLRQSLSGYVYIIIIIIIIVINFYYCHYNWYHYCIYYDMFIDTITLQNIYHMYQKLHKFDIHWHGVCPLIATTFHPIYSMIEKVVYYVLYI